MSLAEQDSASEQIIKDDPYNPPMTLAGAVEPAQQPGAAPEGKALSLWRSANFLKFWTGQSVSKFGDQFAKLAAPLLILALTASPLALGILEVANLLPYLVLGLPAGALIDRLPRRPVMIICDIVRALALGGIVAALLAHLPGTATLWLIYAVTALISAATIFFDMAYLTAVPTIVRSEQLLSANSAVQASTSTAELSGPPLAGVVFQALGAAYAMLADALSFIFSAISLLLIPHNFRSVAGATAVEAGTTPQRPSILREIQEGLRFVWAQPALRWTMLLIAVSNFCSNAAFPVWLFRMNNHLHYSAGIIGVILAFEAVGGIAGSFVAGRLRRFGMLRIALLGMFVEGLSFASYAFFQQPWLFMGVEFVLGVGVVIININILTLRQSITPDQMMGRMQSVVRVIAWSLIPAGALVGTALAGPVGLTPVLVGAGALIFLVALGMFLSPIRRMG